VIEKIETSLRLSPVFFKKKERKKKGKFKSVLVYQNWSKLSVSDARRAACYTSAVKNQN